MKTNSSKALIYSSIAIISCCLPSCINPDYDLSQAIDTEVTILPGKTIPVGDCTPITLQDLIGEQSGNSVLQEAANKDLYIGFKGEHIEQKVSIPKIVFDQTETHASNTIQMTNVVIPSPNWAPDAPLIYFPSPEGFPIPKEEVTYNIDVDFADFPKEITSLHSATLKSSMTLNFSFDQLNVKNIYLVKGTKIIFPAYIILDELPSYVSLDPVSNDLTLTEDLTIKQGQGLTLAVKFIGIDFTRLPEGQGIVEPGHFILKDAIKLDSKVYTTSKEITEGGTFSPRIIISADLDAFEFISLTGKIQPDLDINVDPVPIEGLPEFLPSGTTVDLKGLRVNLAAESSFPIGGSFEASLQPVIGGVNGKPEIPCNAVHLGPIVLDKANGNSPSRTAISLSASGQGAPEGYENVKTEDLDELVKRIPDQFRIIAPEVAVADEECTIELNQNGEPTEFGFGLDYDISVPLAFGPDMEFQMNQDLALALDLSQAGINCVTLDMIAKNTLPLDFSISAEVLGNDDQPNPDVSVDCAVELKAGTPEQPVENLLKLTLTSDKALVIDKVRLVLKATGNAQNAIPLNMEQSLELKKLHLTLPNGITQTISK